MVNFCPTQSLFDCARDLENLGLHLEAAYRVGFGFFLMLCVSNSVLVLHLCGTHYKDHFASETVNVGARQKTYYNECPLLCQ